ncbi:hypothetical protein QN277_010042 [Acacia crassicarpa]|uniref:Uncharacterized protein n=1 Tax=Acacia crassicarpa TaxID=499986 RepID=A0AAE1ISE5_9FABA|nr:hypothetical protein QN277_010042 [Acacia crassicarpa]
MGNENSIPAPQLPPPVPPSSWPPPPPAVVSQRREDPPRPPPQGATYQRETRPSDIEKKREKEGDEKNTRYGKQGRDHHQQSLKPVVSLPENLQDILKEADSDTDKSSTDKLYDQLYSSGLFLSHKTKKLWVNKLNCNCFMLYARALSITWGEDPRYWKWIQVQESSGTMIEAAELKRVCWLEVNGRLDTRKLTAGVRYEVCFHVMLKDPAQGWEVPVNVRLVLPGGKKQEHKENLISKMRVQWIEIPVGQFVAPVHDDEGGEMEFSLYEIEGGAWKQGLVIKGVSVKPKSHEYRIPLE